MLVRNSVEMLVAVTGGAVLVVVTVGRSVVAVEVTVGSSGARLLFCAADRASRSCRSAMKLRFSSSLGLRPAMISRLKRYECDSSGAATAVGSGAAERRPSAPPTMLCTTLLRGPRMVGWIWQMGSLARECVAVTHDAGTVISVLVTETVFFSWVRVSRYFVVVEVIVGAFAVTWLTCVIVWISVSVLVVLMTGVDTSETVIVGVTVAVCWGPTVREKSLW